MQKPFPERRSSVSRGALPVRKFCSPSVRRRNKPSARSFSFRANVSRFKSNFSRRCVSARSSGRFAFFEPVRFNGFLPRQSFPERGIFFKKPKAAVSPKTQKLWLSFAKNPSFS